jgi:hypothetical protein
LECQIPPQEQSEQAVLEPEEDFEDGSGPKIALFDAEIEMLTAQGIIPFQIESPDEVSDSLRTCALHNEAETRLQELLNQFRASPAHAQATIVKFQESVSKTALDLPMKKKRDRTE